MTPKEAFRKLSHKFHGKGPGKMKQEKRQKQFQEELKLKQMNAGDTPLMSMEKIREAQAKMHAPYIVISGHIKPGYVLGTFTLLRLQIIFVSNFIVFSFQSICVPYYD